VLLLEAVDLVGEERSSVLAEYDGSPDLLGLPLPRLDRQASSVSPGRSAERAVSLLTPCLTVESIDGRASSKASTTEFTHSGAGIGDG